MFLVVNHYKYSKRIDELMQAYEEHQQRQTSAK